MRYVISAVHIPLRAKIETDTIRAQNNNMNEQSDNPDTMSDDSDSKENENVSLFVIRIFNWFEIDSLRVYPPNTCDDWVWFNLNHIPRKIFFFVNIKCS